MLLLCLFLTLNKHLHIKSVKNVWKVVQPQFNEETRLMLLGVTLQIPVLIRVSMLLTLSLSLFTAHV